MKTFEPPFFDSTNFIVEKKEFNYLPDNNSLNEYHVAFNVTDNFIMMAGVACVSVLENRNYQILEK